LYRAKCILKPTFGEVMKKNNVITAAFLLICFHSFGQTASYYANITDNVTGGIVGIDPVSRDDLKKRRGYELDYSGTFLTKVTFLDPFNQYGTEDCFFGCRSMERRWADKNTLVITYKDSDGQVTKNDSGVYIEREIYDDKHRIIGAFNYDPDMNLILDSYGVSSYRYEYQAGKNTRISRRFDSSGKQIFDVSRVYTRKVTFDENRLLTSTISYDVVGRPVKFDDGVVGERYIYDKSKNVVAEEYYEEDSNGNAVDSADNRGIHSIKYRNDTFGNPLSTRYYSLLGKPKSGQDNVFEILTDYDADGYVLSERTNGVDGLPCEVNGIYEFEYTYDGMKNNVDEKRLTKTRAVDIEYRRVFDTKNRIICCETFDDSGDPVDTEDPDKAIRYSKVVYIYHEDGQAEARYTDANGDQVVPDDENPRDELQASFEGGRRFA